MNRSALVVKPDQYEALRQRLVGSEMTALHPLIFNQPHKFNVVVCTGEAWYQAGELSKQSIIQSWVEEHGELVIV